MKERMFLVTRKKKTEKNTKYFRSIVVTKYRVSCFNVLLKSLECLRIFRWTPGEPGSLCLILKNVIWPSTNSNDSEPKLQIGGLDCMMDHVLTELYLQTSYLSIYLIFYPLNTFRVYLLHMLLYSSIVNIFKLHSKIFKLYLIPSVWDPTKEY